MDTFSNYQYNILSQWNDFGMWKIFDINNKFHNNSETKKHFKFIAGPPFCSGSLHFGHCAIETIKSAVLNYKVMMGFTCDNKMGYDCHGLPIESVVNRELEINNLDDLNKIGITKFNQVCKDTIKKCERDWEPIYNSIGRWANFDNVYKTMDTSFMESVWWAFKELYSRKLIYRGYKITPYSYALQSPLSNFEANQNYKDVDCHSIYIRFKILDKDVNFEYPCNNIYIVAWTTTPWTLPANIALCVNPDLDYSYILTDKDDIYILGSGKIDNIGIKCVEVLKTVKGSELANLKYETIYNTYDNMKSHEEYKSFYRVLCDKYVIDSATTGTNIVHLAPIFGEDDYRVCTEKGLISHKLIPQMEIIDSEGKYLPEMVKQYAGKMVFSASGQIIKDLKQLQIVLKVHQFRHEYPYCYRTDTPLIYRACNTFYVNVQKIKSRMIELNNEISWYPVSCGINRFNKWLEGATDWCISRSRYFGTPIPVWIADDGEMLVIGSIRELENNCGVLLQDIHPEYVNDLVITNSEGKKFHRVPDIFDCWFESGSTPFAQYHYPFENKTLIDEIIKADNAFTDFIAEGVDQTRGWFYTLLILSTALFDIKPAKHIMSIGHIQDEQHKKISKKSKNYIDPLICINKYGADAIRLYLLQSGITHGDPLVFKEDDLVTINKELFQFKNAADFLMEHITNMGHNGIVFDKSAYSRTTNPMDKWIIQYMNTCTTTITNWMDNFDICRTVRKLIEMIEDISNWYLKFNRDRLKGKNDIEEWQISLSTLYIVINKYITLIAPFAPFYSQYIYNITNCLEYNFIHQSRYNILIKDNNENNNLNNPETNYIETFALLKRIAKLIRNARLNVKTHTSSKTPIKSCIICMDNPQKLDLISGCIEYIQSELNIIDLQYSNLSENIKYKIEPIKSLLGKKYKARANLIYDALKDYPTITTFSNNEIDVNVSGDIIKILPKEYKLIPVFGLGDVFDNSDSENNMLIKIDFTYSEEIENMFHLKQFLSTIQQIRKQMKLKPWNKISLEINYDDFNIINTNLEYIKNRLNCNVNTQSSIKPTEHYPIDDSDLNIEEDMNKPNPNKHIGYYILLL